MQLWFNDTSVESLISSPAEIEKKPSNVDLDIHKTDWKIVSKHFPLENNKGGGHIFMAQLFQYMKAGLSTFQ